MSEIRLPAKLEAAALIRRTQAAGGFATVLARGHAEAGTIGVVLLENGLDARLYERMPQLDGSRQWTLTRAQGSDNPREFSEYLARRQVQDPDLWLIELDVAEAERLVLNLHRST